jgi:glutamine phosphoribosylpyrophosphate amidotransferase
MCGIMGFARTAENTVVTRKAILGTFAGISERGLHASGYAILGAKTTWAARAAVPSTIMAENAKLRKRLAGARLMIGHARFATNGEPSDNRNNHPHSTDRLTLSIVHNGVVRFRPKDIEPHLRTECDSEILLRILEREGIRDGFRRISRMPGADFAVMAIDRLDGALYAFRNEERPLVFANLKMEIGGYLIASTEEILRTAVDKAGMGQPRRVYTMLPFALYRFRPEESVEKIATVSDGWKRTRSLRYSFLRDRIGA